MSEMKLPAEEAVYSKQDRLVVFNQLAVKIDMNPVSFEDFYAWLDDEKERLPTAVEGAQIAEKETARSEPPLNTAIYYDTEDYQVLRTGALLRTSCNKITHAFCAFKMAQDDHSVRKDHRFVFQGDEKKTIQQAPASDEAVAIVRGLLAGEDDNPGLHLEEHYGIPRRELFPALCLEQLRYTFFVWLDKRDALRCSLDRAWVSNLRLPYPREKRLFSEVELAVYPRIEKEVAQDPRVVQLIEELSSSLMGRYDLQVTTDIKYQRGAKLLGFYPES